MAKPVSATDIIDAANQKRDAIEETLESLLQMRDRYALSQSINLEVHQKTRLACHHAATMELFDRDSPSRMHQKKMFTSPEIAVLSHTAAGEEGVAALDPSLRNPFPSLRTRLVQTGRRSLSGATASFDDEPERPGRASTDGRQARSPTRLSAAQPTVAPPTKSTVRGRMTGEMPAPRRSEPGASVASHRQSLSGNEAHAGAGAKTGGAGTSSSCGGLSAEAVLSRIERRWSNSGCERRFSHSGGGGVAGAHGGVTSSANGACQSRLAREHPGVCCVPPSGSGPLSAEHPSSPGSRVVGGYHPRQSNPGTGVGLAQSTAGSGALAAAVLADKAAGTAVRSLGSQQGSTSLNSARGAKQLVPTIRSTPRP